MFGGFPLQWPPNVGGQGLAPPFMWPPQQQPQVPAAEQPQAAAANQATSQPCKFH